MAMTINKSQGQSFNFVGIYLPISVFSHGQLYVALSRVTNKKNFKILLSEASKIEKIRNNKNKIKTKKETNYLENTEIYTKDLVYTEIYNTKI